MEIRVDLGRGAHAAELEVAEPQIFGGELGIAPALVMHRAVRAEAHAVGLRLPGENDKMPSTPRDSMAPGRRPNPRGRRQSPPYSTSRPAHGVLGLRFDSTRYSLLCTSRSGTGLECVCFRLFGQWRDES